MADREIFRGLCIMPGSCLRTLRGDHSILRKGILPQIGYPVLSRQQSYPEARPLLSSTDMDNAKTAVPLPSRLILDWGFSFSI